MAHFSEIQNKLDIIKLEVRDEKDINDILQNMLDICLVILPSFTEGCSTYNKKSIETIISTLLRRLSEKALLIVIGETLDLLHTHELLSKELKYQTWIVIKRKNTVVNHKSNSLPNHYFSAIVYSKYLYSLKHTKTRIAYTFCPFCGKTTKDYGGKKHIFDKYGTLISDVWRDIDADLSGDLGEIIIRFSELFSIDYYSKLYVIDCRKLKLKRKKQQNQFPRIYLKEIREENNKCMTNVLLLGDVIEELKKIPNDSVDFAFADPPYNLKKSYCDYKDDLDTTEYFNWCYIWLTELARILKQGRTCAILNIPIVSIRYFMFLNSILNYQNLIVWDALSFPVRNIMPAFYSILCFSKGQAREMRFLNAPDTSTQNTALIKNTDEFINPLAEFYCLRSSCRKLRSIKGINDKVNLTDLWWDIHRLKHNSRRVNHPCQLPPKLMYRLISVFTDPNEVVIDCFNGVGTTTLAAHQLRRKYIGIEKSDIYHSTALKRHEQITNGYDPFTYIDEVPIVKNSPVPRLKKIKYKISKKQLQLEVKNIAIKLGRLPNREEIIKLGKYPIEYYDQYFISWGEVCAAARNTGMTELPVKEKCGSVITLKYLDLFESEAKGH